MKIKLTFCSLAICCYLQLWAQGDALWVAAKAGLNMREQPQADAKLLDKIPYGTRIQVPAKAASDKRIKTEGLTGYWQKVTYNNKTGYILDAFLLSQVPPKASVKTLKEYFMQVSTAVGPALIIKNGNSFNPEDPGSELHKQLFKNGSEWHQFIGYESGSTTYFLPGFSMQEAFLLLKLIPEFKSVFDEKDEFPMENKSYKKDDREYTVTVEKEMIGEEPWIKKITVDFEEGAVYSFQLYQLDNQVVVFLSANV